MAEGGIRSDAAGAADLQNRRLAHLLHQAMRFDPHATRPVHIGWAAPGSAEDQPVWRICEVTYDGLTDDILAITWANGTIAYAWKWTDVNSLIFS